MRTAEINTAKGVMKVNFFEKDAPDTVENFVSLAKYTMALMLFTLYVRVIRLKR